MMSSTTTPAHYGDGGDVEPQHDDSDSDSEPPIPCGVRVCYAVDDWVSIPVGEPLPFQCAEWQSSPPSTMASA